MRTPRSLWLLVAAAGLHVVEEYAGDWHGWAAALSGLPLQWSQFFIGNAAFLVFAMTAAWLGWRRPVVALSLPALTTINAVLFHVGPTLVTGRYSPGTITAALLYLPLGGWVYLEAARDRILTVRVGILSTLLGAAIMALPLVAFAF